MPLLLVLLTCHSDTPCSSQFDADHVPEETYLSAVLPLFVDPRIGYVACPSICDANKDVSWAVRGRLYIESYMHGEHTTLIFAAFLDASQRATYACNALLWTCPGPLRCSMSGAMPVRAMCRKELDQSYSNGWRCLLPT